MYITNETRKLILERLKEDMKTPQDDITPPGVISNQPVGLPGWICPVCGSGNSPHLNSCPCTGGYVPPIVTC